MDLFTAEFAAEFYRQYDNLKRQRFDPTLPALNHSLGTILDVNCTPSLRRRLRVENGRIKSANRLLLKAGLPKYRTRITEPKDVFGVIRERHRGNSNYLQHRERCLLGP